MKKLYMLVLWAVVPISLTFAQTKSVKGTVKDSKGEPIPGASVLVKGTLKGVSTDADGNFEIEIPSDSQKVLLNVFYLGMKPLTVSSDADLSNLIMEEDVKELKEVIAIGYGTQEKIDNTGSISTIKGKDFANVPVTSYEQAIQGRAAGVQISSASGELGAAMTIRIRGSASVTASNQPLVVIDGFVATTDNQTNFEDNNASNPMADLNPNDIESIQILKDAAAAAIYGARGANGVILIITKRGSGGKTQFNANFSMGISQPTHLRKFLNSDQYVEMFTAAAKNSGYTTDNDGLNQAWTDYGGGGTFSDIVKQGNNENWNKAAYQTGIYSQYGLSATGGNDKTKFYASFGYLDQKGMVISNTFKRLSGRINLDHTVNKWVTVGLSTNQVYDVKNNVPENNVFQSPYEANAIAPILSIKNPDGSYNNDPYYANSFEGIANFKDKSTEFRNFSNAYAAINILPSLTFRSEIGLDLLNLYEYGWQGAQFPILAGTPSSGKYGTSRVINYNTNNYLTYTKTLAEKHHVQATVGQSYQNSSSEYSSMQGQGLPSDDFKYMENASQNTSFSSSSTNFTFTSFFARLNYNFSHKYLIGLSLREDGSSRFGANNRYGWFPAASLGYVISEEQFYKNLGVSNYVNLFKLKSSIGVTGNSEIGNFASRGLYNSTFFGANGGLFPSQLPNKDLKWEKTTQWDIGLELGMFQSRINAGVDYYIKHTHDLLLFRPIPSTAGYLNDAGSSSTLRNVGSLQNKGWDFYINTQNLVGKFKWSTSFNISTYKNTVTDLNGQPILPGSRNLNAAVEGQPLGVFYGVQYAGVDPANGDALFYLADGSTTNNWSKANQPANYKVLGSPNPKNFGGITNTFSFKGFDLSIFGQWSYGNKIYYSSGIFQSSGFTNFGLDNQTVENLSYWKQPGDQTDVPRPELDKNNGARTSSRYLYDGSYFRFKTMTLAYTLPISLVSKAKFTSVKIYVTAQNWFTITKYKGNDPEVNYTSPDASTQTINLQNGVDYYNPPQAKTLIFGITAGF